MFIFTVFLINYLFYQIYLLILPTHTVQFINDKVENRLYLIRCNTCFLVYLIYNNDEFRVALLKNYLHFTKDG